MKWLALAKFFLDSGTEYQAGQPVQHPSYLYDGRVLEFGHIDRSIPVPTGLPQSGDCRIRLADTDRHWRDLLSSQTPRRRFLELRLVPENGSESDYAPIGTFEILDAEFSEADVTITGRDPSFAWLGRKLPNLITRENFPELAEGLDEAFMPVIFGNCLSRLDNPHGVIPLPHIGLHALSPITSPVETNDRWGLSSTPIFGCPAVYRQTPGSGAFTLVDPSEYVITEDLPRLIDGVLVTFVFLDFFDEQEQGTQIRADVQGIAFRGEFFGMPEANGITGPLENPIDALINMLFYILKLEGNFPPMNIPSFIALHDLFDFEPSPIPSPVPSSLEYRCAGAITESMTAQEFLARFLTSFEIDLYTNRAGELEVNLTGATDPDRPVFDDHDLILLGSVRQRLASPTFNRLRYRYEPNFATNEWASQFVFDNFPDQIALGKKEEDIVDFWFVRDAVTADHVLGRRASWVALGSYRIEVDLPTPEVQDDLELAKLFGITHYGGLAIGGYVNQEFKTTSITIDLDGLKTTVRGILRVPQTVRNCQPDPLSDERSYLLIVEA